MLRRMDYGGCSRGHVVPTRALRILYSLYVLSYLLPCFASIKTYLKGQNATLICLDDRSVDDRSADRHAYTWNKTGEKGETILVLTYVSGIATISAPESLSSRVRFDPPYLYIQNLKLADSGQYSCQAIGTTLRTSSTKLEVNSVPTVKVKVNDSPTVDEKSGLYVAAVCQANGGKPPAKVKWIFPEIVEKHDSKETLEALEDGSFNVESELLLRPGLIGRFPNSTEPVTAGDRMKNFTCVVQGGYFDGDEERASTVTIDLMYPPVVTIWIESNKLTCDASGNPAPSILWTRPDGSTEAGRETIFVDQGTPTASSGRYVCLATSALGSDAVSAINVRKSEDLPTLLTNTLRYNASLPLKARGYEMECTAELEAMERSAIERVRFVWTKDGSRIVEQLSPYAITRNVLVLSREKTLVRSSLRMLEVERHRDEGLFNCRLSLPEIGSGYVRAVERSIGVKVDYPPVEGSVAARIHPHATPHEYTDVTLSCEAASSPPSSYRWFFNGRPKSAGSRLILRNISRTEAGMYRCVAFNYVPGSAHKDVHLVVHFPPGRVTVVRTGSGLSCAAEGGGMPAPLYTWLLPNGTMTSENLSTLALPAIELTYPATYTCLVGNGLQKTSNSTFRLVAMKTGGIGPLSVGEFVATLVVAFLVLAVAAFAVWIARRREWGRKSAEKKGKDDTKSSNLLEYTEHPFGGSLAGVTAPRNVFDERRARHERSGMNGSGVAVGKLPRNGNAGVTKYDDSKSVPNGKSTVVSPKVQGKPSLLNYATLTSKSNLATSKESDNEEQPSIYRNAEVLDESGGVEILENESIDATIGTKEGPNASMTADNAIPNSAPRLTTFLQPDTGSSSVGQPVKRRNYYTARNPARGNSVEPYPLHRAASENSRPGLFESAAKRDEKKETSEGRTSAAGMECSQSPQYSSVITDRWVMSPRPTTDRSTPIPVWPVRSAMNGSKDILGSGSKPSFDQPPIASSSQIMLGTPTNPYPSFRHNRVSRTDSYDQFAPPEAEFGPTSASPRCQSVDSSYVLACTPPMAELPARSYLIQHRDARMSQSGPKPVAAFGGDATAAVSPYDSGCDSVRSNGKTGTSKGRRLQSLTLV